MTFTCLSSNRTRLIIFFFYFFSSIVIKHVNAAAPSGQEMPVGNIPGWRQIFTDDFTTNVPVGSFPSAVSTKWWAYPDGWQDTSKNGRYSPSKVLNQQNGVLNMFIHTENGVHMVAAPVPILTTGTRPYGAGLLYGRYVVRFKSDPIPGYKTAWLLWPDSNTWPRDGEIDFPEGDLNKTISAFMHRQDATEGSDQAAFSTTATYTSWHTAVIEWLPTRVTFILDGQQIGTTSIRIPNTPMHWVLQTETILQKDNPPADSAQGNLQIDWVAVYVPDTTPANTPIPTPTPLLPTSTPRPPTITPTSTPMPSTPGDANGDNKANGLDYIIWLNHYNQTVNQGVTVGDFNRDGIVDGRDFVIWTTNFSF